MDGPVARGNAAGLGERRAAGGKQHRDVVARRIDHAINRICRADGDVDHDDRGLARNAVITVRHGHGDVLVRHRDEARRLGTRGVRQGFHDGGEIGSCIGEYIVDAALAEPRDVGFRRHGAPSLAIGHGYIRFTGVGVMQGDGPPERCQ